MVAAVADTTVTRAQVEATLAAMGIQPAKKAMLFDTGCLTCSPPTMKIPGKCDCKALCMLQKLPVHNHAIIAESPGTPPQGETPRQTRRRVGATLGWLLPGTQ